MKIRNQKVGLILEKYKEIAVLGEISSLLQWDLEVNLPPGAVGTRAAQNVYLMRLLTERWNEPEFRRLVEEMGDSSLMTEEKAILRNIRFSGKFYWKVPKEIIAKFARTTSLAFVAWAKAKHENKFKDFLPHLSRLVSLGQIIARHLGYRDNPYDALLGLHEQDLTAKKTKSIFDRLVPELTKLTRQLRDQMGEKPMQGETFPQEDQERLSRFVLRKMGFDFDSGRQDLSSHPFTTTLGKGDVRLTNRYKADDFVESLTVAMHEGGHALYEQGIKEEYQQTPLGGGASLGIHESQSRFWENVIGRSVEFVRYLTPALQAFYPQQLGKMDWTEISTLFNWVKPGLIRVEADEITYNLHIALRFELENDLVNERIKAKDLPEIWRSKMKKYLGIVPEDDSQGVLQDVHWAHGSFGYFPTYTLGNLYAAQFANAMAKDIKVEEAVEKGRLGEILSWLRANIHQYGSLYRPGELVKRVSGGPLNPDRFLGYLRKKFGAIHSLGGH